MNRRLQREREAGLTLVEVLISCVVGLILLTALLTGSTIVQRTFASHDAFHSAGKDQLRVFDMIARDFHYCRSAGVEPLGANSRQALKIIVPAYLDPSTSGSYAHVPIVRISSTTGSNVTYGTGTASSTTIYYVQHGAVGENGKLRRIEYANGSTAPTSTIEIADAGDIRISGSIIGGGSTSVSVSLTEAASTSSSTIANPTALVLNSDFPTRFRISGTGYLDGSKSHLRVSRR